MVRVTEAMLRRRAKQSEEGKLAMAEYRKAERDRVIRMAELRRRRLEKSPVSKGDN